MRPHRVLEVGLGVLGQIGAAVARGVRFVARAEVDALLGGRLVRPGDAALGPATVVIVAELVGDDPFLGSLRPVALLLGSLLAGVLPAEQWL